LILDAPHLPATEKDWPQISLAIAVALCAALESFAPQPQFGVKWPNDVHANGRKIAGILVEIPNAAELAARRVVVGVGLNVNNSWRNAPAEIQHIGTSLCDLAKQTQEAEQVMIAVLGEIESCLSLLVNGDARLNTSWQNLCVLGGRTVVVDLGRSTVAGTCRGIDTDGALVLENETGTQRLYGGVIRSIDAS
ncbi:MAG: biotin--[acetyl-CoA-carboxylase] ligase, partial [Planctomycetales bacterium]|nr:biotin--[acetyl-CoA-carboxylase] ligase [Planctomycetales bacterium]